jgi:hypothetical protein
VGNKKCEKYTGWKNSREDLGSDGVIILKCIFDRVIILKCILETLTVKI